MLRLAFTDEGWEDYQHWVASDRAVLKRVNALITDARREPTVGIGKPELLRFTESSRRSRRITQEHRLVYSFDEDLLIVWQCRYHY